MKLGGGCNCDRGLCSIHFGRSARRNDTRELWLAKNDPRLQRPPRSVGMRGRDPVLEPLIESVVDLVDAVIELVERRPLRGEIRAPSRPRRRKR